jgi:hypothetical protein
MQGCLEPGYERPCMPSSGGEWKWIDGLPGGGAGILLQMTGEWKPFKH